MPSRPPDKENLGWLQMDKTYLRHLKSNFSYKGRGRYTVYVTQKTLFDIIGVITISRPEPHLKKKTPQIIDAIMLAYDEGMIDNECGVSRRTVNRNIDFAVKSLGLDLGENKLVLYSFVTTYRINRSIKECGGSVEKLGVLQI